MATGEKEKGKKNKNYKKTEKKEVQSSEKEVRKTPRRFLPAKSGDAIRVSAKDGQSNAPFLKVMKARVNPSDAGLEVLTVRRMWKDEILLVLKKGGDVLTFEKALDRAVVEKAEVRSLVPNRCLEIRELNKTVTREEVVAALCIALGKPDHGGPCRLYKRFGGVQTARVGLAEVDSKVCSGSESCGSDR